MKVLVNKIRIAVMYIYNIIIPWVIWLSILSLGISNDNIITIIISIFFFIVFGYIFMLNIWLSDTYKWSFEEQNYINFEAIKILLKDDFVNEKYKKIISELNEKKEIDKIFGRK